MKEQTTGINQEAPQSVEIAEKVVFDPSKIEYVWDEDKERYGERNRSFCERLNKGEHFAVMTGPLYEDRIWNASGWGEVYYSLVVLEDNEVMPFPLLENASGKTFEPSTDEVGSSISPEEFKGWLSQVYGEQFVDLVIAEDSDEEGKTEAIKEASARIKEHSATVS